MLTNLTRNTIISKKIYKTNPVSRITGLMGKSKPEALLIKTRFGLHTFFLKFPIDIVVLDNKNKVVFIKRNVNPKSVVFWNIKFDTVFELPEGLIEKSKTKIGDILSFN